MTLDAAPADVSTSAPTEGYSKDPANQPSTSIPQKVKIDDDEELDLEDLKKEYKRYKGKYQGSEQKFREAADMRKQVEGLLHRAAEGDLSWLKGIVPDGKLRQWQEQELLEHIEWESLPDHEKARLRAEKERDEYRNKYEQTAKEREAEQMRLLEAQAYGEIEADITSAIKELGHDVKVTPELVKYIAEMMIAQIEASEDPQDFRRVPAKEARDKVLSRGKRFVPELLSMLPVKEAIALLPDELRKAVRAADVEDAVSQMPRRMRERTGDEPTRSKKDKHVRMSVDDYFSKKLEKKLIR